MKKYRTEYPQTVSQELRLQWEGKQRTDSDENDAPSGHCCCHLSCLPPTRGCVSAVQIWCHWWDQAKRPGAAETRAEWNIPNCCCGLWSGMFGCKVWVSFVSCTAKIELQSGVLFAMCCQVCCTSMLHYYDSKPSCLQFTSSFLSTRSYHRLENFHGKPFFVSKNILTLTVLKCSTYAYCNLICCIYFLSLWHTDKNSSTAKNSQSTVFAAICFTINFSMYVSWI